MTRNSSSSYGAFSICLAVLNGCVYVVFFSLLSLEESLVYIIFLDPELPLEPYLLNSVPDFELLYLDLGDFGFP